MIFIRSHLGLGDNIICNGMARYLLDSGDGVSVFARPENYPTVLSMYRDTPIRVLPADSYIAMDYLINVLKENSDKVVHAGAFPENSELRSSMPAGTRFPEMFYLSAGLDPGIRYSHFAVPRDEKRETALFESLVPKVVRHSYIITHDDSARDYRVYAHYGGTLESLTHFNLILNYRHSANLLDYLYLLEQAAELHLFDSSFAVLVDALNIKPGRRFLHLYARKSPDPASFRGDGSWIGVSGCGTGTKIALRRL